MGKPLFNCGIEYLLNTMGVPYSVNRTGDEFTKQEGQRLIDEIPILKVLQQNKIISAEHKFNSISAERPAEEQIRLAKGAGGTPRYTSGAFKFAMLNKGAPPPNAFVAFH